MAFVVDIVILAIMLVCVFFGYKKGLVGVTVNILGFFIALLIALLLYTPISNFVINNTSLQPNLKEGISDTVKSYVIKDNETNTENEEIEDNSPKVIKDYINGFIQKQKEGVQRTEAEIIDNVSETLSINIIKVAVGIAVFLISKIALIFVKALAKLITKLPIIGQFDKLGGVIYGVLQGLLIIYIILALISLFAPATENSTILEAINSSIVGKMMYNNNIILKFILK